MTIRLLIAIGGFISGSVIWIGGKLRLEPEHDGLGRAFDTNIIT